VALRHFHGVKLVKLPLADAEKEMVLLFSVLELGVFKTVKYKTKLFCESVLRRYKIIMSSE
jgi:hypothetical protein